MNSSNQPATKGMYFLRMLVLLFLLVMYGTSSDLSGNTYEQMLEPDLVIILQTTRRPTHDYKLLANSDSATDVDFHLLHKVETICLSTGPINFSIVAPRSRIHGFTSVLDSMHAPLDAHRLLNSVLYQEFFSYTDVVFQGCLAFVVIISLALLYAILKAQSKMDTKQWIKTTGRKIKNLSSKHGIAGLCALYIVLVFLLWEVMSPTRPLFEKMMNRLDKQELVIQQALREIGSLNASHMGEVACAERNLTQRFQSFMKTELEQHIMDAFEELTTTRDLVHLGQLSTTRLLTKAEMYSKYLEEMMDLDIHHTVSEDIFTKASEIMHALHSTQFSLNGEIKELSSHWKLIVSANHEMMMQMESKMESAFNGTMEAAKMTVVHFERAIETAQIEAAKWAALANGSISMARTFNRGARSPYGGSVIFLMEVELFLILVTFIIAIFGALCALWIKIKILHRGRGTVERIRKNVQFLVFLMEVLMTYTILAVAIFFVFSMLPSRVCSSLYGPRSDDFKKEFAFHSSALSRPYNLTSSNPADGILTSFEFNRSKFNEVVVDTIGPDSKLFIENLFEIARTMNGSIMGVITNYQIETVYTKAVLQRMHDAYQDMINTIGNETLFSDMRNVSLIVVSDLKELIQQFEIVHRISTRETQENLQHLFSSVELRAALTERIQDAFLLFTNEFIVSAERKLEVFKGLNGAVECSFNNTMMTLIRLDSLRSSVELGQNILCHNVREPFNDFWFIFVKVLPVQFLLTVALVVTAMAASAVNNEHTEEPSVHYTAATMIESLQIAYGGEDHERLIGSEEVSNAENTIEDIMTVD